MFRLPSCGALLMVLALGCFESPNTNFKDDLRLVGKSMSVPAVISYQGNPLLVSRFTIETNDELDADQIWQAFLTQIVDENRIFYQTDLLEENMLYEQADPASSEYMVLRCPTKKSVSHPLKVADKNTWLYVDAQAARLRLELVGTGAGILEINQLLVKKKVPKAATSFDYWVLCPEEIRNLSDQRLVRRSKLVK